MASEGDTLEELRRLRLEVMQAKGEDKAAVLQQYDQHYALLMHLRQSRPEHQVDPDSPYFGHLQLREGERQRDLFLGKATRLDGGLRILDWRNAPIARLFYRYQEGEEYEEEMGGRVFAGTVQARRTVAIQKGVLTRVDAPQGIFVREEDGSWSLQQKISARLVGASEWIEHKALAGSEGRLGGFGVAHKADKHLPDIAALIDPEQFQLISAADAGLVVLRGGAGSGKTTVALHRIAWLAFQDPQRFRPHRMLVLVWGKALRDYISGVLPGLGVGGVPVDTWHHWANEATRRAFPFLPRDRATDTPEVVTRLKLHPALLFVLEEWVRDHHAKADAHGAFEDWCQLLTDTHFLFQVLEETAPGDFTRAQLERVGKWSKEQQDRILNWMEGEKEAAELDEEDEPLLLRLYQLRVGPLKRKGRPMAYSHLVVDEVQDLAPIEVAVLVDCADRHQSVTLAGDTQQHVLAQSGFGSWDTLLSTLGGEQIALSSLEIGYRSTARISAFAHGILGDLAEGKPGVATRDGPEVELFRFTDHGACVAFLADALGELMRLEPQASVALLARRPHIAQTYYEGLVSADLPHIRRVVDQTFAFAPGVEVTEVSEVKGLEFDYVVLLEASAACYPDDAFSRRLLHVGATRACHQLWLTAVETPSPILRRRSL